MSSGAVRVEANLDQKCGTCHLPLIMQNGIVQGGVTFRQTEDADGRYVYWMTPHVPDCPVWIESLCPVCGQLRPDRPAPPGVPYCTPLSCPSWRTEAIYDHEAREWLHVDPDGYVLDGRRQEDVR